MESPGLLSTCEDALETLRAAGATVTPVPPPVPAEDPWTAWVTLRAFGIAADNAADFANPNARAQMKEALVWECTHGAGLTPTDIRQASTARARLFAALSALLETYDALALPSTQVWPFPVEEIYPTEIAGTPMTTYHRWMECMVPASLTGLPALSLPAGLGAAGLPAGLQLIGPKGGDDQLIALAEAWHPISPIQTPPPGVPRAPAS